MRSAQLRNYAGQVSLPGGEMMHEYVCERRADVAQAKQTHSTSRPGMLRAAKPTRKSVCPWTTRNCAASA